MAISIEKLSTTGLRADATNKIRTRVILVTFDNNYPTGGYSVNLANETTRSLDAIRATQTNGYMAEYDSANEKLKVTIGGREAAAGTDLSAVTMPIDLISHWGTGPTVITADVPDATSGDDLDWALVDNDMYAVPSGNIGVGTNTPDTKFHLAGNIKIVDGSQASGYVLTSDADGVGTWQSASAITGSVVTVTANYSVVQGVTMIRVDATSGDVTITLPDPTNNAEIHYTIVKVDTSANLVKVVGNAGEAIGGGTTQALRYENEWLRLGGTGTDWELISKGESSINAADFGAIGDDDANDTAALQAAIDAAHAIGGGVVQIPPGTYLVYNQGALDATLPNLHYCLKLYSDIILRGSGRDSTIIKQADSQQATILGAWHQDRITIEELTIDGNVANNPDNLQDGNGSGIYCAGAHHHTVRNVKIQDAPRVGMYYGYAGGRWAQYNHFENVEIHDSGDFGMAFDGFVTPFCVHNCIVKGSGNYGIYMDGQLNRVNESTLGWATYEYGCQVIGGVMENNKAGIFLRGCRNVMIDNVTAIYNGQTLLSYGIGIVVYMSDNVSVSNCHVISNYSVGITLSWSNYCSVTGCNCRGNAGNGITLNNADYAVVSSNVVHDGNDSSMTSTLSADVASAATRVYVTNNIQDDGWFTGQSITVGDDATAESNVIIALDYGAKYLDLMRATSNAYTTAANAYVVGRVTTTTCILEDATSRYNQIVGNQLFDYGTYSILTYGEATHYTHQDEYGRLGLNTRYPSGQLTVQGRPALPLTGTISVTNGSDAAVGSGTAFTAELHIGNSISISGYIYYVTVITDDTHLTLNDNFTGVTGSGLTAYCDSDLMRINMGSSATVARVDKDGDWLLSGGHIWLTNPYGASDMILDTTGAYSNSLAFFRDGVISGQIENDANAAMILRILDSAGTIQDVVRIRGGTGDALALNVGINTANPRRRFDILDDTNPQARFTHTDNSKFVDLGVDTNHDFTITPSSTGKVIAKPTTDNTAFFQVHDTSDTPIMSVDTTNRRTGFNTVAPEYVVDIKSSGANTNVMQVVNSAGGHLLTVKDEPLNDAAMYLWKSDGTGGVSLHTAGDSYIDNTHGLGIGTKLPDEMLHVGDATNKMVVNPTGGGIIYSGTARPTRRHVLGAYRAYADGSNNTGTMSEGHDVTNRRNYIRWSPGAASQDYDAVFEWQLPANFSSFPANCLSIDVRASDYANASITTTIIDGAGNTDAGVSAADMTPTANNTWETKTDQPTDAWTADEWIYIYVKLEGDSANTVDIARVTLEYLATS